jgi:glycosyltransferase involved in cell wall biosynthesis
VADNSLISVIIPVYNVEKYLPECLDSVINQSYKNLEIIIINDGSTDNSLSICNEYKEKDSRIRVISQENKGLAATRNVSLAASSADYIMFLDADDYINLDTVKVLYENIQIFNADMSLADYTKDLELSVNVDPTKRFLMSKEDMYNSLYDKHTRATVCASIIKKSLFGEDLRFPEGKIHEDAFVIHKLIDRANIIVYSDNVLYYYRMREDSITHKEFSLKNLDYLEVLIDRMNFMRAKKYDYFYAREFYRYVNELRLDYKRLKKYYPNEKDKIKEMIINYNKAYNKHTRKLIIKWTVRLKLDLFRIKSYFIEKYNLFN